MVNIYETEGGKLNALQDFEEGCWVKVTAATMWEMEPVAEEVQYRHRRYASRTG